MLVNQDAKLDPAFWDLVKAMGARGAKHAELDRAR